MTEEHPGRHTLLGAIMVAIGGILPVFLTGGLAVQIRADLDFGPTALGVAFSAFFGTQALVSAPIGRMIERVGPRRGMRVAAFGSSVSLLCIAFFADSWSMLVLCLVLGGLANSASQLATNLSLARGVSAGNQGLAFGMKEAAKPAASLFCGIIVPLLGATLGWRWAFLGCAAGILIVAVRMIPEMGGHVAPSQSKGNEGQILPLIPLLVLALGAGLGSAATVPLTTFLVESGVAVGLSLSAAGALLGAGGLAGIGARIAVGWFADQRGGGHLRLVSTMLVFGAAGFCLIGVGDPWLLVIGTVVAFGAGWGWPGLFSFAVVKHNPSAPAAATGIVMTGFACGSAAGPFLFGLTLELTSFQTAWISSTIQILLAAVAMIAGRWLLIRYLNNMAVRD